MERCFGETVLVSPQSKAEAGRVTPKRRLKVKTAEGMRSAMMVAERMRVVVLAARLPSTNKHSRG